MNKTTLAGLLAGLAYVAAPGVAQAQAASTYSFNLPAQGLGDALRAVAAKAGWELYAQADAVNGRTAAPVKGVLTARAAIEQLLRGTRLVAQFSEGAVIIRSEGSGQSAPEPGTADVVVTGSRIRGSDSTAPVKTIAAEDMQRAGQVDLGEALRSIPENFAGGQNPGVGTSQGSSNVNVNGASSVNLLGIGPNATLTLLDGNRLSYTGTNAAIDIAAIPLPAVDRVEIVTDGASAIYGADAIAGVVNVRLRKDYDGATVQAGIGGATDGGDFEQHYDAVFGHLWGSGGILAAYDYLSNSPVLASQRTFASGMGEDSTLYPGLIRHSGLISAHQDLGGGVSADIDATFKDSRQDIIQAFVSGAPHIQNGAEARAHDVTFAIAPTLSWKIGNAWALRATGAYSTDRTEINSNIYALSALSTVSFRRYNNGSLDAELGAEGALLTLPAGDVRLAIGGGYRRTWLDELGSTGGTASTAFDKHRDNAFGYAELHVPVLAPEQYSALGRSFSFSGAFRWEHNSGVGSIAVPKIGLIYAPVSGLTFKASWGKSFRLPALYEQYQGYFATLLPVGRMGSGYPAGATVIELTGARPDMRPERSENWTLSAELQPRSLAGFKTTISYFHYHYTDRVATPLASSAGVLDNPIYASLVSFDPGVSDQQMLASGASLGLQNGTGATYNPSTVVAIVDARDRNISQQTFQGVDASLGYRYSIGQGRSLDLDLAGTWITSEQQVLAGLPFVALAGTLFNPPKFKARLGLSYASKDLTLSAFGNLTSRLTDLRTAAIYSVHGLATCDLSAQFRAAGGWTLSATIDNVFDQKPETIVTASPYDTAYDSTNFSAIGRFLSLSLSKSW